MTPERAKRFAEILMKSVGEESPPVSEPFEIAIDERSLDLIAEALREMGCEVGVERRRERLKITLPREGGAPK